LKPSPLIALWWTKTSLPPSLDHRRGRRVEHNRGMDRDALEASSRVWAACEEREQRFEPLLNYGRQLDECPSFSGCAPNRGVPVVAFADVGASCYAEVRRKSHRSRL
jgi:hypothetical protein